jgi:putative ABC transport system permease protein
VIQSVREGLTREARAMTGADVVVRSDRPFGEKVRASVAEARARGRVGVVSEAVEIATMVRPTDATMTRMVELRAVQSAFPLYGTMTLQSGKYAHALLQNHGTLVRPELLAQLNLRVGDDILIGSQRFQIRGVIDQEPGRNLGAFSLGSRLFIGFCCKCPAHHRRQDVAMRARSSPAICPTPSSMTSSAPARIGRTRAG